MRTRKFAFEIYWPLAQAAPGFMEMRQNGLKIFLKLQFISYTYDFTLCIFLYIHWAQNLWFLFPLVLSTSSHHENVIKWHQRGNGWKYHHLSEIWQCFEDMKSLRWLCKTFEPIVWGSFFYLLLSSPSLIFKRKWRNEDGRAPNQDLLWFWIVYCVVGQKLSLLP